MPIFLAALLGGLVQICGSLVGRVLLSLGIGYATYGGLSVLATWIKDEIFDHMSSLPIGILNSLALMQVDVAINIVFSAYAARMVLAGFRPNGTITKMIIK